MGRRPLNLQELQAFNDLLVMTVRGRAPLVHALRLAETSMSPRFRAVLNPLTGDLEEGRTLSEALDRQPEVFDPTYRQIVQAGEQGQHLHAVLESFSVYLNQLIEMRRGLIQALLYPLFVLVVAYILFIAIGKLTTERIVDFFHMTPLPLTPSLNLLSAIYANVGLWWWILPAFLLVIGLSMLLSRRAPLQSTGAGGLFARYLPGFARILHLHRLANFTHVLASLLEHHVPFDQALRLAARASGDPELGKLSESREWSQAPPSSLPPFLGWLLTMSHGQQDMSHTLHQAAEMYRRRAQVAAEWLKILSPLLFLVLIGGGATLLYVLTIYYPFTQLLFRL